MAENKLNNLNETVDDVETSEIEDTDAESTVNVEDPIESNTVDLSDVEDVIETDAENTVDTIESDADTESTDDVLDSKDDDLDENEDDGNDSTSSNFTTGQPVNEGNYVKIYENNITTAVKTTAIGKIYIYDVDRIRDGRIIVCDKFKNVLGWANVADLA